MTRRRSRDEEYSTARDGKIARRSGAWAKEKLSFLDEFLPAALQATIRKTDRYYVDLFAGPGLNIDDHGEEFVGAALRALRTSAQANEEIGFTHAILVNLDAEAHTVLQERVEHYCADGHCFVPHADVRFFNRDANDIVHRIMSDIPKHAYVFVLADIENPSQLPFETVQALKAHGHRSVDFCVLFPEDMALKRMLPYEPSGLNPNAGALNRFLGTDAWSDLWKKRQTDAQSPELYREIQRLYESQLRTVTWKHVEEVRDVRRVGAVGLYKILLASKSDVAKKLANWSAQKQRRRKSGPELFD